MKLLKKILLHVLKVIAMLVFAVILVGYPDFWDNFPFPLNMLALLLVIGVEFFLVVTYIFNPPARILLFLVELLEKLFKKKICFFKGHDWSQWKRWNQKDGKVSTYRFCYRCQKQESKGEYQS
jgi:hypothetical protein